MKHLEQDLAGDKCYSMFAAREDVFESIQHNVWFSSTTVAGTCIAVIRIRMIHVKSWHIVYI